MSKQAVDRDQFKLLAEHLRDGDSLQLAMRWMGRRQMSLCETLQRLILKKKEIERRLVLSPDVKHRLTVLVSRLAKDFTLTFSELQSAVEMKRELCSRLQSLGLQSVTQSISHIHPELKAEKQQKKASHMKVLGKLCDHCVLSYWFSSFPFIF